MVSALHVYRKIVRDGVEIKVSGKKYTLHYPRYVWNDFPKSLHRPFADAAAYIATWHLPYLNKTNITYHFPHPLIESIFSKLLLFSLPMNIFENRNITTSQIIKNFYNTSSQTKYKGRNFYYGGKRLKRKLEEKALVLFSFGKDSLLTYGLLNELGVKTLPFFINEPQSAYENLHKRKLAEIFLKKTGREVDFFKLSIGRLRQGRGFHWGWDLILSQYAFILLPYYFYHRAKYLFIGNEQTCNFSITDDEGFLVNPVFEQSVSGMQLQQDFPKAFFIKTHIGSLIEPLHDHLILFILHRRYPDLAQFQMSCFAYVVKEAKKNRWCGACEKCARLYILFKGLGINPVRLDFKHKDMLGSKKKKFYPLFTHRKFMGLFGSSGLGRDEQLLSFYLAYRNGVKGELITEFKKKYLKEARERKNELIGEYFGIHSTYTLPRELRSRVLKIYKKERDNALKYIRKII